MSLVRRYAAAGLDAAARRSRRRRMTVGALDETGQEKQGSATAGVKRQYMGCAGRVANGINTVHLSYVREKTGHALAGARQWIPAEDISDPVKSLVTGLPVDLGFRTKGQLAIGILDDAYADGLAFDFICGDEVYGSCTELREYLEGRGQAYVLRVASSFTLTLAAGTKMTCAEAVSKLLKRNRACFGLDQCQARLCTAILRHTVLVMAAVAVCAVTAAQLRDRTDSQAPRQPGPVPGRPPTRADTAHRPRGPLPARRSARPAKTARPCRPLTPVATSPPGTIPLVPPTRTPGTQLCPDQLAIGCCRTRRPFFGCPHLVDKQQLAASILMTVRAIAHIRDPLQGIYAV